MIVNYSFLPHLNVFLYPSFTELMEVMCLPAQTQTHRHTDTQTHTHTNQAGSSFGLLFVLIFVLVPNLITVFHRPLATAQLVLPLISGLARFKCILLTL